MWPTRTRPGRIGGSCDACFLGRQAKVTLVEGKYTVGGTSGLDWRVCILRGPFSSSHIGFLEQAAFTKSVRRLHRLATRTASGWWQTLPPLVLCRLFCYASDEVVVSTVDMPQGCRSADRAQERGLCKVKHDGSTNLACLRR